MTPPISVSDLGVALATRGWKATICDSREFGKLFPKEELVDVDPAGYLKCVDGRGSDAVGKQQHGPKMLGGVYGIALNRGIKTTKELEGICQEVAKAGHVPTVHGDEGGILGCGFCKLWLNGKFADEGGVNAAAPEFTADEGAAAVKSAGGVVENHVAKHTEKYVILNFCPDKTFVPNGKDQRFIVDCWALGKFNLDITKYALTAAATVEKLNPGQKPCPWKAYIVTPAEPRFGPAEIVGALQGRGWQASIQTKSMNKSQLVPVDPAGYLKCVDGRGSDAKGAQQRGPKMLGGVYGIAVNRGVKELKEIEAICQEVKAAGHVPTVHGDESGILGCGFCKLWLNDKFADEAMVNESKPKFDAQAAAVAVEKAGGVVENHVGKHTEKIVYLNFIDGMTLEPNALDQRFIVDAWAAGKFGLDIPKYCVTAAATVEKLNPGQSPCPWKAVLIVPDDHEDAPKPAPACCTIM